MGLDNVTILLLEMAWGWSFKQQAWHRPEATILPYLEGHAKNYGTRVIFRQVRSAADLTCWTTAMRGAPLGDRVIWLAGHGYQRKGGRSVEIAAPDHIRTNIGVRILPRQVKRALSRAGQVSGVIATSCSFGLNRPEWWLPNNVSWALAHTVEVGLLESVFLGFKTLEWLFEDDKGAPTTGSEAKRRWVSGLKTGRSNQDPVRMVELASDLGAVLAWRKGRSWFQSRSEAPGTLQGRGGSC